MVGGGDVNGGWAVIIEFERGRGAVSECCIGGEDWLRESPAKDMDEGEAE